MALQPRHRWMVSQVVAAFKLENEEAAVEFAFRGRFSPKIEKFLSGASRRQHLLFAFHQGNATPSSPGALNSDVGLDAKLICTDGAESGLQSRSIYFLKTTQRGKAVNLNVASDGEVIFGEIAAAPLASLDVALTGLFLPIVEKFNEKEWYIK
ncbi:putative dynein heavy chain family protein [Toxoplasma gondii TgCatPRC2]|uniref:Dynein heavy chain family protein n=14 Tax=Toxoplasma gondii TaxID=5811 RepID=A0A125YNN3_TOXGV|nr:hypothetical protein TGME49_306342 [Toxoplasma gondii ME49]EPR57521.1 hypothetical protein TGGT1_306342 [Toxoplasma gondii GT1]ESS28964.1 putative dynein heavy chain family protein [Toxoplasma gondii VEG]KAF4644787.1 hypothetical protein TGRH88_017810 [Toxoplasma gondii]KFG30264.1 putative dynein heavy chain family protein [Toxoplasma gondii p89]KFG33530.1 putative dynein heavy chain family protein [Toxoplasma gondii GAB2-2007-GAL-DOM2]KFG44888.1 putative dynein heavy chain family protein |eukprot:XP_018636170.1 hypothetical protein TGME49_306342 [Toxoplasma gondii ME49]